MFVANDRRMKNVVLLIDFSLPELNSEFLNKRRSRLRLAVKRLLPDGDKIIMIHERMHQILS